MIRLRTITAPTYLRGQVERVATTCAMLMKYSSHVALGGRTSSAMLHPSSPARAACGRRRRDRLWSSSDVGPGDEVEIQGYGHPAGYPVPDAGRSGAARAGDPRALGPDEAVRADLRRAGERA